MEKIIEKIAEMRTKKGFSYENVAQDLDLSTSAYRKIETGETKLTVERLKQLSKVLETPLEDFLEIEIQKNFNQENHGNSKGVQGFNENMFNDYKKISSKMHRNYEIQIEELKKEINRLKNSSNSQL